MSPEAVAEGSTGRRYRSKKQRPCDLCRSRKIQCKLQGNEAACELCRKLGRQCTFVIAPLRRKYRPRLENGSADGEGGRLEQHGGGAQDGEAQQDQSGAAAEGAAANGDDSIMAMDTAPLWLQMADSEQTLSPQTAANIMSINWGSMDFSMGALPSDVQHLPPNELGGFTANSLSPTSNVPHPVHLPVSSESPNSSHRGDNAIASNARRSVSQSQDWSGNFSLDSKEGCSNVFVGLSSEFDPSLLRHYFYNMYDIYPMFRLHVRKLVDDEKMPAHDRGTVAGHPPMPTAPLPVQFLLVDDNVWKEEEKATERLFSSNATEADDAVQLNQLVPADHGARLVKLYSQFVHPGCPVLSLSQLSQMFDPETRAASPVGLRSAVYALAAPFTFLDDELSVSKGYLQVPAEDLWAIAHRSYHRAARSSHLSLLQLCLLLLQMPPHSFVAAEPPAFWALACSALAIAETLGLTIEPSDWRLPRKEVMLRRRLWWVTYTVHTWLALVCGQPSHIHDGNWDVSRLTANDFEKDHPDPDIQNAILQQIPICLAQYELSTIAADVLKEFYTLRASRESLTLGALLNRAQPLRTRIETWRQTLSFLSKPASELTEEEFEKGAALRLSHLTLEILIFRALLRPLLPHAIPAAENSKEPISTIFENCFTCAKVATEIVSSLRAKHFANFWPHYTRYQLCYISTFVLLNLAQSTTNEMAVKYRALLGKWRDTLRIQAQAWPLARLAAMRLDAIFWKGLSSVVHGAGPDSPAVMLFKENGSKGSGE
ncbi:hypothetical protein S7711_02931 [Stachybotrys chartarum IBT 7711]|uniref:Zn(2)-C6 fungal-type domain-containing protein n=1 Tax=Stachybotrys chartarum (strain CBS 109288 / IBT 7711) TaxID=1280523 RepID=A0A084B2C3_STACB|nr:hypothetical protein S7711_02931 [Stachybotrys chartarum IBT 7711]